MVLLSTHKLTYDKKVNFLVCTLTISPGLLHIFIDMNQKTLTMEAKTMNPDQEQSVLGLYCSLCT